MSTSIVIRFIRNTNNQNLDDVVSLFPVWENVDDEMSIEGYKVRMEFSKAASCDNRSKRLEQVVTADKLTLYLSSMIQLVVNDNDPYEHIQVDLPTAPSVLFTASQLHNSMFAILGLVDVTLHSWPKLVARDGVPCS